MANQAHLQEWLHQVWLDGALTFQEAWSIQDEVLLSTSNSVVMPESLDLPLSKLHLYQAPTLNSLPL